MSPRLRLLGSLALLCILGLSSRADVVINEIMAQGSDRLLRWNAAGVPQLGFGESWYSLAFDDSSWQKGAGPFGFGTFANVTAPTLGTDMATQIQNLTPTMYLRKSFTYSLANAATDSPLVLDVRFNDGFICYLNGVEVVRRNAGPPGQFNYHDQVSASATPAAMEDSTTPYIRTESLTLSAAARTLLREGTNTIAIQALNFWDASNVLNTTTKAAVAIDCKNNFFFQGDLKIAAATPVPLVSGTDQWNYFPGVTEPSGGLYDPALLFSGRLSVPWGLPAFDDSTWAQGPAPFGAGSAPAGVTYGTNLTSAIIGKAKSLYTRTVFTVTAADLADGLPLQLLVDWDDSFVAYINGVEVARDRLGQANAFTPYSAVADSTRNGGTLATYNLDPPAKLLNLGENVLSVQVHNLTLNDSDLLMRAQLRTNSAGTNRTMVPLTGTWRYWIGLNEPGSIGENPTEADSSSEDDPEGPDASLDWVELYNNGTSAVSLSGWGLSDDAGEPLKWKFPATASIPAGGYLLVVCDGLNITTPAANGYLHTSFKLSGSGETMTLANPSGVPQQQITYPTQTAFQSYGRASDGSYKFFDPPTPRAANTGTALEAQVAAPTLSVAPGFYSSTQSVNLATTTSGAIIRYTIDGSEPTETTGTAGTTVSVTSSRSVRARAFKTGLIASPVTTGTYLINEASTRLGVPALCITGDLQRSLYQPFGAMAIKGGGYLNLVSPNPTGENSKWSQMGANAGVTSDLTAYNNPLQHGRFIERPGNLELLRYGTTPLFSTGFGLRVSGSASARPRYKLANQNRAPGASPAANEGSWASDAAQKSSFNFYFRSDYGADPLDTLLFPGYPVHQFHDLRIRAGKNDIANPFVEDEFMRRLFINTGQVGAKGFISTFYVNGIYKGYYNPVEHVREEFLRQHHGGDNSWDIRQVTVISAGDGLAFQEMITYIRNNPQTTTAAYQGMKARLDMVNFIDYLIVNLLGNTGDWPHNNYICARERVPTGKHRFYMWDAEGAFGDFSGTVRTNMFTAGTTGSIVTTTASTVTVGECIRILFTLLKVNPEFRVLFADRLQKHFFNGGALTEAKVFAEWAPLKTQIQGLLGTSMSDKVTPWISGISDATRYTTSTTTTGGVTTTTVVNSPSRRNVLFNGYTDDTTTTPTFVQAHLVGAGLWPATLAPVLSNYGGTVTAGTSITITNPNSAGQLLYTVNGLDPRAEEGTSQGTTYNSAAPPVINFPTTLKARVLNGSEWSPLIEATFDTGAAEPLLITELMYHPADNGTISGDEYEFVEIKNVGTQALSLSGMSLGNGLNYTFPNGSSIAAGELKVIARSATRFAQRYPGVAVLGEYGLAQTLSNSGETIDLISSTGKVLCSVAYQDISPWPVAADGAGYSLVPVNPTSNPQPSNAAYWRASTNLQGSPGADDPAPPVPPIYINEVLANAPPQGKDRVELFNPNASAVDISYWWLSDRLDTPKKYQFPAGTILPSGGYLVLSESEFNVGTNGFAFSANGDSVVLSSGDATGAVTSTVQNVTFGASESGVSFGRYLNSRGQLYFTAQTANTFGAVNSGPKIGPLIISELMYKPGTSGGVLSEFSELRNVSNASLDIGGWKLDGVGVTFPTGTTVPAGGFLLVLSNPPNDATSFRTNYAVPSGIGLYGPDTGSLSNSGERITIQKPGTPYVNSSNQTVTPLIEIDAVNYGIASPWPTEPATAGKSLERISANAFGDDPVNWRASSTTSGTIGSPAALPFGTWQAQYFTSAEMADPNIGGSNADPDGDGLSNFREWAHGLNPWQANGDPISMGTQTVSGSQYVTLQVRRSRSATGLTIAADTASSLGTWSLGSGVQMGSAVDNGDGTESLTFRDASPMTTGTPSHFLRLRLTAP